MDVGNAEIAQEVYTFHVKLDEFSTNYSQTIDPVRNSRILNEARAFTVYQANKIYDMSAWPMLQSVLGMR
jgi:hypothetical protein